MGGDSPLGEIEKAGWQSSMVPDEYLGSRTPASRCVIRLDSMISDLGRSVRMLELASGTSVGPAKLIAEHVRATLSLDRTAESSLSALLS